MARLGFSLVPFITFSWSLLACLYAVIYVSMLRINSTLYAAVFNISHAFDILCLLYWTCTHRHVTCPRPDTSAACSAGSGFGWSGQSGSSSDAGTSTPHCSVDSSWRNPRSPRDRERQWEPLGWAVGVVIFTHLGYNRGVTTYHYWQLII